MTRIEQIQSEMRAVYGKLCDAAVLYDSVDREVERLKDELEEARAAVIAATSALKTEAGRQTVSMGAYIALLAARNSATAAQSLAEVRWTVKLAESQRHHRWHDVVQAHYDRLNSELAKMGAVVLEFGGRK